MRTPTCPKCGSPDLRLIQNDQNAMFVMCKTSGCNTYPVELTHEYDGWQSNATAVTTDRKGLFVCRFDVYAAAAKAFGVPRQQAKARILKAQYGYDYTKEAMPPAAPDADDLKALLYVILGQEKLAEMGVNQKSTQAAIAEVRALRHNLHETTPDGMKRLQEELSSTKAAMLDAVIQRDGAKNRAEQAKSTAESHKKQAQDALRRYNQLRAICEQLTAKLRSLP